MRTIAKSVFRGAAFQLSHNSQSPPHSIAPRNTQCFFGAICGTADYFANPPYTTPTYLAGTGANVL